MAIRMTGLVSGLDTDSIVQELVSAYATKKDDSVKAQTKLSWKQDAWKALNTKIYSLYKKIGDFRYDSAYNMKKTTVSDSTKATITAGSNAIIGTQSLQILSTAKSEYLTGGELKRGDNSEITGKTTLGQLGYSDGANTISVETKDGTKEIKVDGSTTLEELVKQFNDAGVTANLDTKNGRLFVSAKNSGTENAFKLGGSDSVLKALGLTEDSGANRVEAEDAEIILNGATFKSSTNQFNVNGLTINVTGVTGDRPEDALTITTETDVSGLYDKIKDFLSDYNDLINEMTSLYNADTAKGYEPLTSDEKDAMSESEIEKWEAKIKDSLLRRDTTLSTVMSGMTNAMASAVYMKDGVSINYNSITKTYQYNGEDIVDSSGKTITTSAQMKIYANANGFKAYNLSSFGIATLGYLNAEKNEYNAYHIYGDEDDTSTSGKADQLMAMLQSDPDTVVGFMKGLANNLYNAIDGQMKSTSLSSAYVVYNDKQMAIEYSDYTSTIKKWDKKLEEMEEYYYKKFSAMETALSKLQNQTSSLTGLLGG
ncbi:MAG: flagellar filament capping protein FliD [Eubacterium sp.]|nr:flagellar filament capping protein FliD [Eubacterium sp.]